MTMPSALRRGSQRQLTRKIDKCKQIRKIWEVFHGFFQFKCACYQKLGKIFSLTRKLVMMRFGPLVR